jgi:DNA-nicking Smr family endonuclease
MNYPDAVIHLEAFIKEAEALELNIEEFKEKIEPYRLSLVRHAADNVTSQRMVKYVFHRLTNYVRAGRFLSDDRVDIRIDLHRLSMAGAHEPREPKP